MGEWKVSEIYEPQEKGKKSINQWSVEDRPRERLMKNGAESLSSAELLAILIGSGTKKESAVDLMKRLLDDCGNSLAMLSKKTINELTQYNGIGEAKAITILAACELGRRREQSELPRRVCMKTAKDLYEYLWPRMRDLDVEEAFVVLMNQRFAVIDSIRLSHGGITETAVDVRLIIKHALMANATVIALAHNHPSGNTRPSRDDDMITRKVNEACKTMRLHFMDHIIITDGDYYSYNEEGKM